jgi:hypothetical protein
MLYKYLYDPLLSISALTSHHHVQIPAVAYLLLLINHLQPSSVDLYYASRKVHMHI